MRIKKTVDKLTEYTRDCHTVVLLWRWFNWKTMLHFLYYSVTRVKVHKRFDRHTHTHCQPTQVISIGNSNSSSQQFKLVRFHFLGHTINCMFVCVCARERAQCVVNSLYTVHMVFSWREANLNRREFDNLRSVSLKKFGSDGFFSVSMQHSKCDDVFFHILFLLLI